MLDRSEPAPSLLRHLNVFNGPIGQARTAGDLQLVDFFQSDQSRPGKSFQFHIFHIQTRYTVRDQRRPAVGPLVTQSDVSNLDVASVLDEKSGRGQGRFATRSL